VNTPLLGLSPWPMLAGMGTLSLATPASDADGTQSAADPQPILNPSSPEWAQTPSDLNPAFDLGTVKTMPDPAICRVRESGFGGYADCLVKQPILCPHALSFGYGNLCRNPQRDAFALRTTAQYQAEGKIP